MICRCPCCCTYVLLELLVALIVHGVDDDDVRVDVAVDIVDVMLLLLVVVMMSLLLVMLMMLLALLLMRLMVVLLVVLLLLFLLRPLLCY